MVAIACFFLFVAIQTVATTLSFMLLSNLSTPKKIDLPVRKKADAPTTFAH